MSRRTLTLWFRTEEGILGATRAAGAAGHEILDVHTPYAVHGLDAAAGLRPSRLPWICFALGLAGAAAKLWYQIWTSATSWPVNVGGKPLKSVPAFVPVTFEIMVLFAALGTVAAFFLVSGLRPGRAPRRSPARTTDDRFALVLAQSDAAFDAGAVRRLLDRWGVEGMEEGIDAEPEPRPAGAILTRPALGWTLGILLAGIAGLTYLLPRTFTEPNAEFLPGMAASVPYDPFSGNPNFPDGKTLRVPPEGTIARGFLPLDTAAADAEARRVAGLVSALPEEGREARTARGSAVYTAYCQPCHGPSGAGDGPVPAHGFPPPPSLQAAGALLLTDGQIFNIITRGRGNMPPLAGRIPRDERWLAVEQVRRLQAPPTTQAEGRDRP